MIGILNIHKPAGVTSRDVVNQVQRLVRPVKIGHAGTLDPLATGVLVLCLGRATKLIPYVQKMRKSYRGTFLLGRESDTEDVEGEIRPLESPPTPDVNEIHAVLPEFIGEIQQRPPAYSALKVAGKRAYDLARRGEEVKLAERPILMHRFELVDYDYPKMVLDIECGSGTYVRSLGRDVAMRLGTAAVMSELVRTGIGEFTIDDAIAPEKISKYSLPSQLLPALTALDDLPKVVLSPEEAELTARGMPIEDRFDITSASSDGNEIAAVDGENRLLALLVPRKGGLGPMRNFG